MARIIAPLERQAGLEQRAGSKKIVDVFPRQQPFERVCCFEIVAALEVNGGEEDGPLRAGFGVEVALREIGQHGEFVIRLDRVIEKGRCVRPLRLLVELQSFRRKGRDDAVGLGLDADAVDLNLVPARVLHVEERITLGIENLLQETADQVPLDIGGVFHIEVIADGYQSLLGVALVGDREWEVVFVRRSFLGRALLGAGGRGGSALIG